MTIGQNIATRSRLRVLANAPHTLVHGLPRMYSSFRREALREGRHYQASDDVRNFIARNRITPDEVDVLLLIALRHARRIIYYSDRLPADATPRLEWLEGIKSRYLMQVFVDEATDLSAVQLACTVELADPNLRSWFASGDLRQRVTGQWTAGRV
jgi:superfamily I DNA/RNA helicase